MFTFLIILLHVFAAYIVALAAVHNRLRGTLVPPSLSENFYLYEEVKKGLGWIFYAWCAAIGVSLMAVMFQLSEGKWFQFIALFAGGGLALVGCAPRFKERDGKAHEAGAVVCASAAFAWCLLSGCFISAPSCLAAGIAAAVFDRKNGIFWCEMGMFAGTFLTLLLMTA
ncbi:MAG: hypothetical protein MdMp024_0932 [Bacteroidales bacterium]